MVYTRLVLDTRRKKPSGIYPIKLRITFNREQKYYVTTYQAVEADFSEVMKDAPPKRLQELKIQLGYIELKAKNIIAKLEAFSFMSFEEKFYESRKASKSIYELYEETISEKMAQGKISTAVNYKCSMKSLQVFAPKLSFIDITPKFLKAYERHLLQEGKSISTVGIYMRPLRAIFNEAINNKYIKQEHYPFGIKKYIIPESRNVKKALTKDDFRKLVQYSYEENFGFEARSKDFWLLSYLCQGMNIKDLLLLKRESVEGGFIRFIRQKTKDTIRRNISEITAPLLPETKAIIAKWENKDSSSPFLFGFINENMSAVEVYKIVQQFIKVTNKHLKKVAEKLGIDKKVTSYVARFQFTKTMIDADVSLEYLRQCLGHQSFSTTKRYIGSFEMERKHEIAQKHLLNFK